MFFIYLPIILYINAKPIVFFLYLYFIYALYIFYICSIYIYFFAFQVRFYIFILISMQTRDHITVIHEGQYPPFWIPVTWSKNFLLHVVRPRMPWKF